MATHAYPISNGKVNSEGLTKLISTLYTSSGVVYADSLTVAASGTPDMNVVVSGSLKDDVAVFIAAEGMARVGWNTDNAPVVIDANGSGVTKKDSIVAYIDLTKGDAENANAPGGLTFMAVRGSGTDTPPSSGDIDSAIGHSYWILLAHVTVANGATSINSGNISDQRVQAKIAKELIEPLGADQIADGTVTTAKIASEAWTNYTPVWTTTSGNGSIGNGTIVGKYRKIGRSVRVSVGVIIGSTTSFGSGALLVGVPYAVSSTYLKSGGFFFDTVGIARAYISASGDFFGNVGLRTPNEVVPRLPKKSAAGQIEGVNSTSPGAWAAGDQFSLEFEYESEN